MSVRRVEVREGGAGRRGRRSVTATAEQREEPGFKRPHCSSHLRYEDEINKRNNLENDFVILKKVRTHTHTHTVTHAVTGVVRKMSLCFVNL